MDYNLQYFLNVGKINFSAIYDLGSSWLFVNFFFSLTAKFAVKCICLKAVLHMYTNEQIYIVVV